MDLNYFSCCWLALLPAAAWQDLRMAAPTRTTKNCHEDPEELIVTVLDVFWKIIDSILKEHKLDDIDIKHLSNTKFSIFDVRFELIPKSKVEDNVLQIIIEANCLEEGKMLDLPPEKKYKLASFTNLMRTVFSKLCEATL